MIARIAIACVLALPAAAAARSAVPFGTHWADEVYSRTGPWISAEATAGVGLAPLDPSISSESVGAGSAYGLRGIVNLNHFVSFPVEMEFRSYTATPGSLKTGWSSYVNSAFLLGSGVRFSPWATEHLALVVGARFGMYSGSEEATLDKESHSWGGVVAYFGGSTEFVVFPVADLSIGLGLQVESLTPGPKHNGVTNWEVDVPPDGGRTSGSATLRVGWNF